MIEYFLTAFSYWIIVILLFAFLTRIILKSSIKKCMSEASMIGKTVIVTGANTGIGFHTAKDIDVRGGRVILACRNEKRGATARDQIIAATGNKNVVYKKLNLSSLESVRKFAEDFQKNEPRLDVLVNNAGVHALGDRFTEDNIVEGMQINYFAPFLLTLLLLPMLKEYKGRIVNLSSVCHFRGEVKINKINAYSETLTYANSKLCSTIFTKELARRLETGDSAVTVNAVHPGVILTNIVSNESSVFSRIMFRVWCWLCCRTAEEGAQTVVYLSVAEEVNRVTGKYFVDCKERIVLWTANNKELAKQLWDLSEKLVGLTKEEKLVLPF